MLPIACLLSLLLVGGVVYRQGEDRTPRAGGNVAVVEHKDVAPAAVADQVTHDRAGQVDLQ